MKLQPGLVIGSYRIDREIGRGGRAVVYRAWQQTVGRWVVLKVLRKQDPGLLEDFRREVQLTANLGHRGVRQVYDAGQTPDGYPFLAMQFVDTSLRQLLRTCHEQGRTFSYGEAARILEPVADALDHIHSKGLVHLDVKPENILMFQDGRVVLADFGSARQIGGTTHEGTPTYFSPEQAAGDCPVCPQSDIYSLAVVAYEMLAGQLPFGGDMHVVLVRQHLEEPPRPLRQVDPHLSRDLEKTIDDTLSKDPRQRPASASAFIEQIRTGGRRSTAGVQGRSRPSKRRGVGLWILLIVAVTVTIVLFLTILLVAVPILNSASTPTPTPTFTATTRPSPTVAFTPSPSRTPTATPLPTDTPRPTSTPTPTRPPPTRTPTPMPSPEADGHIRWTSTPGARTVRIQDGLSAVATRGRFTRLSRRTMLCCPV